MYCKKCKYTTFDHLDRCPKCGYDWKKEKEMLGLEWLNFEVKLLQNILAKPTPPSTQELKEDNPPTAHQNSSQINNEEFIEANLESPNSQDEVQTTPTSEGKKLKKEQDDDLLEIDMDTYLTDSSPAANSNSPHNEINEIENLEFDDLLDNSKETEMIEELEPEEDLDDILKDVEEIDTLLDNDKDKNK